jgi:hypothetical protein
MVSVLLAMLVPVCKKPKMEIEMDAGKDRKGKEGKTDRKNI